MSGLLLALMVVVPAQDRASDRAEILKGVKEVARGGIPGNVIVFGDRAFGVLTYPEGGNRHQATVAGSRLGRGRMVAFGHGSFFGATTADSARFAQNAIRWAGGRKNPKIAVTGGGTGWLEKLGFDAVIVAVGDSLGGYDLVVQHGSDGIGKDPAQGSWLVDWIRKGGGFLCGTCPWGVQQLRSASGWTFAEDSGLNRVLMEGGLVFGTAYSSATSKIGFSVAASDAGACHAGDALARVMAQLDGEATARSGDAALVSGLVQALPKARRDLLPLGRLGSMSGMAEKVPAEGRPASGKSASVRLPILLASLAWAEADPKDVPAAPGHEWFPGAVAADAERIERTVTVPPSAGQWISTGLYAPAGEVVTVSRAGGGNGWRVRIGAHTDNLMGKDSWARWPNISIDRALTGSKTMIASAWGGLIYLVVPGGGTRSAVRFQVTGAVEAPWFDLQDPKSVADWPRRRKAPAPWAEMACDGLVITVPSESVRGLDDPTALMEWWTRVHDCYEELRGAPSPQRPERLVEDIQISAGWMHAGYPIMTHGAQERAAAPSMNLAQLSKSGDWGYFHELGHNYQRGEWTFGGTGEVTCNLFSLYVGHQVCGIDPWDNPWLQVQKKLRDPHLAAGAPFDKWQGNPGLALMTYAEIQKEFGWEPFRKAMRAYGDLPEDRKPKDDQQKRDRWVELLSRGAGRNLAPFHELWGWPLTMEAHSAADLPIWWPQDQDR